MSAIPIRLSSPSCPWLSFTTNARAAVLDVFYVSTGEKLTELSMIEEIALEADARAAVEAMNEQADADPFTRAIPLEARP